MSYNEIEIRHKSYKNIELKPVNMYFGEVESKIFDWIHYERIKFCTNL